MKNKSLRSDFIRSQSSSKLTRRTLIALALVAVAVVAKLDYLMMFAN